ncbi:hypothetical protein [Mangrovicoccus sp. HB161399]|uniref:hypothetical protein n=1 Tax=Mangrovicoccus sp. HB161399 TaxID=2720392 RepID=UPI0015531316|nr:hypothetical protein [Mangrovicoccus sp. HB161399]
MTRRPDLPRLEWKKNPRAGEFEPRHRITWTEGGKRKERTIRLDWKGDTGRLLELYWKCEAGLHDVQKPKKPEKTWRDLVIEWRKDQRIQRKLADSTKVSYRRTMEWILEKNADLAVKSLTHQRLRAVHDKYSGTPRKADHFVQVVKLLWNYGNKKLRWSLGENPAEGLDLFETSRPFEPWPEWMVAKLDKAPEDVRNLARLILGRGERPGAAVLTRWERFAGDSMTVIDQKGGETWEVFCPPSLSDYLATIQKRGTFVLAKNLSEPLGYDAVEKQFRDWRKTMGEAAKPFTLHGLRKLAIVQLAEAGCSEAEIQAITNQTPETIAYYRRRANRLLMSRNAQMRRERGTNRE